MNHEGRRVSPLKAFIRKIYHQLPIKFRYQFSTLVWKLLNQIKSIYSPVFPQVFIFKGLEKNSQLPLIFAYLGVPSQTQHYWAQASFAPGFQKHLLGRCFYKSIISFLKEKSQDCDFLLIECNRTNTALFFK